MGSGLTSTSTRTVIIKPQRPPLPTSNAIPGTAAPWRRCLLSLQLEELAMAVVALETSEQLSRALGEAIVRIWGRLPPNLQNRLFEEAVTSEDE
jgi:hypothetical protein